MAHQLADKAEAAYQRGTLFPKRVKLMAVWAADCASPAAEVANVLRTLVEAYWCLKRECNGHHPRCNGADGEALAPPPFQITAPDRRP